MSPSDREPQASLIVGSELRELSRVSAWVQGWAEQHRIPTRPAPIIRRFSDGLHYRREAGRNCLTLIFRPKASP